MTTAAVEKTPEQLAAETAAADKAAADKAVADKAAADKAAADKAAAEKAAADAAAADKAAAEKKAADEAELARKAGEQPKAPDTYDLTLPADSSHLTDVDLELIAAEAKTLGLTNDQAQSLVDARNGLLVEQSARLLAEAKADPDIGGDKFDATVQLAQAGVAFLFPNAADAALVKTWFNNTGLGNHKVFLKAMARIGKARKEDTPIGGTHTNTDRKETADVLYPSTAAKS